MYYMLEDPIATMLGDWSSELGAGAIIFRIIISIIFSAIIGCERSSKRHSAGLRTFILVSLASTIAMLIDLYLMQDFGVVFAFLSTATIISTAMLSGNSILFTSKNQIKGLTTSVGLWATGIIGLSIGAGLYTVTTISFIALICTLYIFPKFESALKDSSNHFEIHLELKNKSYLQDFVTTIRKLGLRIDDIELNPAYINSGLSVYSISITIDSKELKKYKKHSEIIKALSTLEYIYYVEEIR